MIFRTNTLNFILKEFTSQNSTKIVEIIGEPGIGKSSIISQIPRHFENHSMTLKLVIVKPAVVKSLFQLFVLALTKHNISIPKSLIKQIPKSKEDDLRLTLELIYLIRENEYELVLIVFDDFHELIKDFQDDIKLIFNPNYMVGNYGLLILARPSYKTDLKHNLLGFTKSQFIQYVDNKISKKWRKLNSEVCNWIYKTTIGHPFYVNQFIEHLLRSGLISENELTVTEIKSLKIPPSITQILKSKIDSILKDKEKKYFLHIVSFFPSEINIEKLNFINSLNSLVNNCIQDGIIRKFQFSVEIYHPLIKEYIYSSISNNVKTKLINDILKNSAELNEDERLLLIKELPNKTISQRNEIINYAKKLEDNNKLYLAIEYLSSIKNYKKYPETLALIGNCWMNLTNIQNAGKYFEILLNNPKFNKNRKYISITIFYLISTQKFDDAFQIIKYCLEKEDEITDRQRFFMHVSYIWMLVRKYDWDNIEKSLIILEKNMEKSKYAKINYYKACLLLCSPYPKKFNSRKLFKEAVEYVIREKEYKFVTQFSHTIMCYYIKFNKEKQIDKYYNLVKTYSKKSFSLDVKRSTDTFYAAHLVQKFDFLTALKTFNNYGDLSNYQYITSKDSLILTKFNILLNVGNYSIVNELIQKFSKDKKVLPMTKLVLFTEFIRYFILLGKYEKAMAFSQEGINLAEKHKNIEKNINYKLLIYVCHNNHEKLLDSLLTNPDSQILDSVKFTCTLSILSKEKNIADDILNLIQSSEDSFYRQFLLILYYFKKNELDKGLTILAKIENEFDGQFLPYFHIIYKEFGKVELINKDLKHKFSQLKSQISYILNFSSSHKKNKVNRGKLGFGFNRIIQNWYLCLAEKKEFDETSLEFFTNDFHKIEKIKTALKLWDINVVSENSNIESGTMYINMFGKIQMIYKSQHIQFEIQNKITKFQKLILCYSIIYSNKFNEIPIEKLLETFYPEKAFDKSYSSLQIHISRINSNFKTLNIKLLTIKNGYLIFNNHINFVTDLDKFANLMKIGDQNCINNNWVQARYNFEVCLHLYQSNLLINFDEDWIEPLRSFYLENYIKIIESLMAIYEELDLPQVKLDLLQKVVTENPYIDEFQEYLDEMQLSQ